MNTQQVSCIISSWGGAIKIIIQYFSTSRMRSWRFCWIQMKANLSPLEIQEQESRLLVANSSLSLKILIAMEIFLSHFYKSEWNYTLPCHLLSCINITQELCTLTLAHNHSACYVHKKLLFSYTLNFNIVKCIVFWLKY